MPTVKNDITSASGMSDEEKRQLEDEQAKRNLSLKAPSSQVRASSEAAPTAPKGSGSYKNLGNYLSANVGATEGLAGGISQKVGGELETGKQGVISEGQNLVKTAEESGTFTGPSELPTDITDQNSAGFKQVQSGLGATWTSPTLKFDPFAKASETFGQSVKKAESTASQEGLTGLAAQAAKDEKERLSAGERRFSGYLLGKDVAAQDKFSGLRDLAGGMKSTPDTYLGTDEAPGLIGKALTGAEAKFKESQEGLKQKVLGKYGTTKTDIETGTAAQAKKDSDARAKLIGELDYQKILQDRELSELRNSANDTRNSMPMRQMYTAKYLKKLEESEKVNAALGSARASQGPTASQYVTPEQAAALNALAVLSGQQGISAGTGYSGPSIDTNALREGFNLAGRDITYEQFLPPPPPPPPPPAINQSRDAVPLQPGGTAPGQYEALTNALVEPTTMMPAPITNVINKTMEPVQPIHQATVVQPTQAVASAVQSIANVVKPKLKIKRR